MNSSDPQWIAMCTELRLIQAAAQGDVLFLQEMSPLVGESIVGRMLVAAAHSGQTDCVRFLVPLTDPNTRIGNRALTMAASKGYAECVALLIPVSDPKAHDSNALQWAVRGGHAQCVELLYGVSDVQAALKVLQHDKQDVGLLVALHTAQEQKALLRAAVAEETRRGAVRSKI